MGCYTVLKFAEQIENAINCLHENKIVYRDLVSAVYQIIIIFKYKIKYFNFII